MHTRWRGAAAAALAGVAFLAAAAQARAASRVTPIVEAVRKTRGSILTLRVERAGGWGAREVVGTGVVVDERGYAVTNRHVIRNAERVSAVLADGTELRCRVFAEDLEHDLAILRIQTDHKLQALTFAPAGDLMVGETVIAIGHPLGYTNTVSTGIVSALNRQITMPEGQDLDGLIQTDASINPGNSGGPLLNINGELIGINIALREGAQGIAFALNSDTVQEVLSKHLSASRVARLGHGLKCHEVVTEDAAPRQRLVVDKVSPRSPAAAAGLQPGDVLVRVGDKAVTNRFDLERALWDHRPGDQVPAAILRHGKPEHVAIRLAGLSGE
jgi:serine protease Do